MDPVIEVPTTADVPTDVGRDNPLADFLTSSQDGSTTSPWPGQATMGWPCWPQQIRRGHYPLRSPGLQARGLSRWSVSYPGTEAAGHQGKGATGGTA